MDSIKLVASEGMMLTNGTAYGRVVYLASDDSADNWYEITKEEAEARMAEIPVEDEATEEDYQSALREMGVNV